MLQVQDSTLALQTTAFGKRTAQKPFKSWRNMALFPKVKVSSRRTSDFLIWFIVGENINECVCRVDRLQCMAGVRTLGLLVHEMADILA